jgi:hypothetical protein
LSLLGCRGCIDQRVHKIDEWRNTFRPKWWLGAASRERPKARLKIINPWAACEASQSFGASIALPVFDGCLVVTSFLRARLCRPPKQLPRHPACPRSPSLSAWEAVASSVLPISSASNLKKLPGWLCWPPGFFLSNFGAEISSFYCISRLPAHRWHLPSGITSSCWHRQVIESASSKHRRGPPAYWYAVPLPAAKQATHTHCTHSDRRFVGRFFRPKWSADACPLPGLGVLCFLSTRPSSIHTLHSYPDIIAAGPITLSSIHCRRSRRASRVVLHIDSC